MTTAGVDNIVYQGPSSYYNMIENKIHEERESIVKDLLTVPNGIYQAHTEPKTELFVSRHPDLSHNNSQWHSLQTTKIAQSLARSSRRLVSAIVK